MAIIRNCQEPREYATVHAPVEYGYSNMADSSILTS